MSLSPMVAEWAAAYEQEHGGKPLEQELQIMEHIMLVRSQALELGKRDAIQKHTPHTNNFFRELFGKVFGDGVDQKTIEEVADLWQMGYIKGYHGGKQIEL